MKYTIKNMRKGFTLVELLVVIAIIAALAGFATPLVLKQLKKADMAEATHNAKQLYLALVDFDQDVGAFPRSTGFTTVDSNLTAGTTANEVLRQLFIRGSVTGEENFYAKTAFTNDPDGDIGTAPDFTTAIEGGELGFVFTDLLSTSSNASLPLLAAPALSSGGAAPIAAEWDSDAYAGKMILLRVDGAVKQYNVDTTDNQAKIKVGGTDTNIFDAANTAWANVGTPAFQFPDAAAGGGAAAATN